jgi:hypothetical protein
MATSATIIGVSAKMARAESPPPVPRSLTRNQTGRQWNRAKYSADECVQRVNENARLDFKYKFEVESFA